MLELGESEGPQVCEGKALLQDGVLLLGLALHPPQKWLRQGCFEKGNLKAATQQQLAWDGMVFISQKGTF